MSLKNPREKTVSRFNKYFLPIDPDYETGFIFNYNHSVGLVWFNKDAPLINTINVAIDRDPDYIANNMNHECVIEKAKESSDPRNNLISMNGTMFITDHISSVITVLDDPQLRFYLIRESGFFHSPLLIVNSYGEGIMIGPWIPPEGHTINAPEWGCNKCGYIPIDGESCLCE